MNDVNTELLARRLAVISNAGGSIVNWLLYARLKADLACLMEEVMSPYGIS